MHLLVFGANGLLGTNVVREGLDQGWRVSGTYHSTDPGFDIPLSQLDITDSAAVETVIEDLDPDWVVNCAAMTDVDGCEETPELAHAVNAVAPGEMAAICAGTDRGFLHVSTDYVFDGESTDRYSEDAAVNPIQVYGESKLAGERAVRTELPDALITRLSFIYGVHHGTRTVAGFPAWVRDRLLEDTTVPLFTDQHVTPSRAGHTAETFCELIEREAQGVFNVPCRSCVTPYEFGAEVCSMMDADESLLARAVQSDVERAATRPAHTCLDVTKVAAELGREQPTLAEDLGSISAYFEGAGSGR